MIGFSSLRLLMGSNLRDSLKLNNSYILEDAIFCQDPDQRNREQHAGIVTTASHNAIKLRCTQGSFHELIDLPLTVGQDHSCQDLIGKG